MAGPFLRKSLLIDLFTLALTHGLIALALIRLMFRADLDSEGKNDA